MMSEIRDACIVFMNTRVRGVPIKTILKPATAALAFGTLAEQLWISAEKVATNPSAREQVFHAMQRVTMSDLDGKEDKYLDNFETILRVGTVATAVLCVYCIGKTIWVVRRGSGGDNNQDGDGDGRVYFPLHEPDRHIP